MSDYSFYVTSAPPELPTPFGGHRAGRTRQNPFDLPVKQSWEQRLVDRGEWLEFKVDNLADLRKEINRIRSAGQHLKIGTEVRADKASGRVAFRGTEYKPRAPRASKDATPDAGTVVATNDPAGVAGGQATADQAPWDWQASPR
jgi:hypothetical protein